MRDISDRYHVQRISSLSSPKQIGGYLVEAGLLTHDQINVALNDQQATGMRFGEIIVARGWLKEQTVEWIVTKVIEPERQLVSPAAGLVQASTAPARSNPAKFGQPAPSRTFANSAASSAEAQVIAQPTPPPTAERVAQKASVRRDAPIAKPLPSVSSPDGDVNWVG